MIHLIAEEIGRDAFAPASTKGESIMKKRVVLLGLCTVMCATLLTGCNNEKGYENDAEEIADFTEDFYEAIFDIDMDDEDDLIDSMKELTKTAKGMKMQTSEGKKVKKDFQELTELLVDAAKAEAKDDDKKLDKLEDKMDDISDALEDDIEDFIDAAEDKGVDEEDLALGFYF